MSHCADCQPGVYVYVCWAGDGVVWGEMGWDAGRRDGMLCSRAWFDERLRPRRHPRQWYYTYFEIMCASTSLSNVYVLCYQQSTGRRRQQAVKKGLPQVDVRMCVEG